MNNTDSKVEKSYAKLRLDTSSKSLFDPDLVLKSAIHDFIKHEFSKPYQIALDYGAGNSPYRPLFDCEQYLTADVEQNEHNSIDYIINGSLVDLDSESVDLIVCSDVLEHIFKFDNTIAEIYRLLKPGGELFISFPFINREHETPYDFFRYTTFSITKILQPFEIQKLEKVGNLWFILYSLLNENHIKQGEKAENGVITLILKRIFNLTFLPILNLTLFKKSPKISDGTFHHILVKAIKR